MRNAESAREGAYQLFVGSAFYRRGCDAHAQASVMLACHRASRGARHDLHREANRAVTLGAFQHLSCNLLNGSFRVYILSSVPATACLKSQISMKATIGEMSIMPSGGMMRRSGTSSGSVARIRNRMMRFP